MKLNVLLFLGVFLFGMGPGSLRADNLSPIGEVKPAEPSQPHDEKMVTFSVGPLLGVPASANTAKEYNVGGGGEFYIGLTAAKNFQIGLEAGYQDYTVNLDYIKNLFQQVYGLSIPSNVVITGDYTYFPLMAVAKVSFGQNKKISPYLLLGAGAAINQGRASVSASNETASITVNETTLLLSPGLGAAFRVAPDLELFIQGRLDISFTSINNSDDVTLTLPSPNSAVTTKGNLSDDSPTLFIPIQAGVRFL